MRSAPLLVLLLLGAATLVAVAQQAEEDQPKTEEVQQHEEPEEEEDLGEAQLVIRRGFLNTSFAEGVPMHVKLEIFNIGTKEATEVEVSEPYPESMGGPITRHYAKILPMENVTETYVVTPTAAEKVIIGRVTYSFDNGARRGAGDLGWQLVIESAREYARRTDPHYVQWAILVGSAAVAVGLPAMLWRTSKKN